MVDVCREVWRTRWYTIVKVYDGMKTHFVNALRVWATRSLSNFDSGAGVPDTSRKKDELIRADRLAPFLRSVPLNNEGSLKAFILFPVSYHFDIILKEFWGKSFKNRRNKSGPITEICGTPLDIVMVFNCFSLAVDAPSYRNFRKPLLKLKYT